MFTDGYELMKFSRSGFLIVLKLFESLKRDLFWQDMISINNVVRMQSEQIEIGKKI